VAQWSDDPPPPEALASFVPRKPVPPYKLNNEGKSELCRDAGGPNAKKFYGGWVAFIRTAYQFDGTLTVLKNDVAHRRVALYTLHDDLKVTAVPMGSEVVFDALHALAIVPELNTDLDVLKMDLGMFKQVGDRIGASTAFGMGDSQRSSSISAAAPPTSPTKSAPASTSPPEGSPLPEAATTPTTSSAEPPTSPDTDVRI